MMYPYPREYPSEAVKILLDFVSKAEDIEKKDAIHASWVLSGYALNKMFGGGPAIIGSRKQKTTKLPVSDLKRKEFVEQFIKARSYGTLKKFEEDNPSCWQHLYQLAKVLADA
ncbi:MAG: hypothetical protein FGM46_00245 [Ferruginibacter sp.]|nr:hypothetical protein [Ferruginibacter sp.]